MNNKMPNAKCKRCKGTGIIMINDASLDCTECDGWGN